MATKIAKTTKITKEGLYRTLFVTFAFFVIIVV